MAVPGISGGGGGGNTFGNDKSQDTLSSRSSTGDVSLSSPFIFGGDASAVPGGTVPAWVIGVVVVAAVAAIWLRG